MVEESPLGIVGPRGLPTEIIKLLHDSFKKSIDEPDFLSGIGKFGMFAMYLNAEDFTEYWAKNYIEEGGECEEIFKEAIELTIPKMRKTYIIANILWLAFALASVCAESWRLDLGAVYAPGPGFFPFIVAVLLGILSVISLFRFLKEGEEEGPGIWAGVHS